MDYSNTKILLRKNSKKNKFCNILLEHNTKCNNDIKIFDEEEYLLSSELNNDKKFFSGTTLTFKEKNLSVLG